MKKFKVISGSRFLDKSGLENIGGGVPPTCRPEYAVTDLCVSDHYLVCGQRPTAAPMFENCNEGGHGLCSGWFTIKW